MVVRSVSNGGVKQRPFVPRVCGETLKRCAGAFVEHSDPRLRHNVFHDFLQVPGLVVNLELAIRAAAHLSISWMY